MKLDRASATILPISVHSCACVSAFAD